MPKTTVYTKKMEFIDKQIMTLVGPEEFFQGMIVPDSLFRALGDYELVDKEEYALKEAYLASLLFPENFGGGL